MGKPYVHYASKLFFIMAYLKELKNREDLLIMFTDAYDVLIYQDSKVIKDLFTQFNARVVFSAEYICNPDKTKAPRFPTMVSDVEKRFLNSGGYIGYASDIFEIVSFMVEEFKVQPSESDQKNFQEIYLNEYLREKHNIKLDHNSTIFFNVYASADDLAFQCKKGILR